MKLIRISIPALFLLFSMQLAKAQVQIGVGVNIGAPRRTVVIRDAHPVYRTYPRTVYYERPVYRRYPRGVVYRPYGRPRYHKVYHRGGYHRGYGYYRGHGRYR